MPLTLLDAACALVVIDLQKGIAGLQTVHPAAEIIERSARLAGAFRQRGLPVVLVNVTGRAPGRTDAARPALSFPPDFAEIAPELGPEPGDILVTKQRVGAFLGTSLDETLRSRGVTQVFLTGIATSAGVEATARSAYDLGYNVVFVTDAITDRDAEAHSYCVEKVFPRLGETDTADSVLKMVERGKG